MQLFCKLIYRINGTKNLFFVRNNLTILCQIVGIKLPKISALSQQHQPNHSMNPLSTPVVAILLCPANPLTFSTSLFVTFNIHLQNVWRNICGVTLLLGKL